MSFWGLVIWSTLGLFWLGVTMQFILDARRDRRLEKEGR